MPRRLSQNWSPEERWQLFADSAPGSSKSMQIDGRIYYHPTLNGINVPALIGKGCITEQHALVLAFNPKNYYASKIARLNKDLNNGKNRLQKQM